ncbi:MAG: glyoxalase [Gammaproteobacteria bacterium RIFCSPHIGHO2_12_FULL_35_23]|nr:MAG: glyoxalase [Gammaproteobacteria bacterium RIFCSPHIGHO2_12_FULL_35_23]
MLDHLAISVDDYEKSKAFYSKVLAPLGYTLVMEFDDRVACFGVGKKPSLIIHQQGKTVPTLHLAFYSKTRAGVDEFYQAALLAGGKDNGVPGIREKYHPNYYGAFIFDPDGHNIEAVCHAPE